MLHIVIVVHCENQHCGIWVPDFHCCQSITEAVFFLWQLLYSIVVANIFETGTFQSSCGLNFIQLTFVWCAESFW